MDDSDQWTSLPCFPQSVCLTSSKLQRRRLNSAIKVFIWTCWEINLNIFPQGFYVHVKSWILESRGNWKCVLRAWKRGLKAATGARPLGRPENQSVLICACRKLTNRGSLWIYRPKHRRIARSPSLSSQPPSLQVANLRSENDEDNFTSWKSALVSSSDTRRWRLLADVSRLPVLTRLLIQPAFVRRALLICWKKLITDGKKLKTQDEPGCLLILQSVILQVTVQSYRTS